MQTDHELFTLIKETYPLNPRPDFVSDTEDKLRKAARKMNRKRTFKRLSVLSCGFLFSSIVLLWIFSYSGNEVINNTLSLIDERHSSSIVNQQEPLIYIYHSHNKESFISETKVKDPNMAFHSLKNITLVGERLSQDLNNKSIKNIHENRDVMEILKDRGLTMVQSYTVSREALSEALKNHKFIKMVFDIHRDTQKRNVTTTKINGKDFARITFTVSRSSVNYDKNVKFAESLHKILEEKYPGLSRGVVVKSNPSNQSTYNQDLKDDSALLDIGGVENTLAEEYRTVDAFAKVIEELLKKK